jgi:hypothetical protein
MPGRLCSVATAVAAAAAISLVNPAPALAADDAYLRGYVTAVLDLEQRDPDLLLDVRDGVAWLDASTPASERADIEDRVESISGVTSVQWLQRDDPRVSRTPPRPAPPTDPGGTAELTQAQANGSQAQTDGLEWVPSRPLFEPLTADPRWPRFAASFQRYQDDPELTKVGAVALGGTVPILQADAPFEGRWEFAIQGGVFSIFDLEASSLDLVNSDFFAAFPVSARWSGLSFTLRPYHQSSHLGDEYLLRDRVERIDVSVEGVDLLASLDLWGWGRLYGGGGLLLNRDPDVLERRSVQAGIELVSPWALFGTARPMAALDVQRSEENDWSSDYSGRLGLQIENQQIARGRRLQVYAEYYKGFSPNGQFFQRRIEYLGGGLNFFF